MAGAYLSQGKRLSFASFVLQFAEDAAVAGGFDVVEPLAVVADTTVRTRLHAF